MVVGFKAEYWRSVVSGCITMLNGDVALSYFLGRWFGVYQMLIPRSELSKKVFDVRTFVHDKSVVERCALNDCKIFAVVESAYNT